MAPLSFFGGLYANGRDALSRREYRTRCRRPSDGRAQAGMSDGHDGRTSSDLNRKDEKLTMDTPNISSAPCLGEVATSNLSGSPFRRSAPTAAFPSRLPGERGCNPIDRLRAVSRKLERFGERFWCRLRLGHRRATP